MAGKRKKARRGFGSTAAVHQARLTTGLKDARIMAKAVRSNLASGRCANAVHALTNFVFEAGLARAEMKGMGERRGGKGHGYGRGRGLYNTYASLTKRVIAQCVKR